MIDMKIDPTSLLQYSNKYKDAQKVTGPAISSGLNVVGDQLVVTLSHSIAHKTGLSVDQVRRNLRAKRSTRNTLAYEIELNEDLFNNQQNRAQEKKDKDEYGRFKPGEMVIVKTQDDELVCMDCEELGAAGPIPIDIAMQHVPKHPNCRCIIMPYAPKGKRLPVTMTTLSGTDARQRMGKPYDENMTLRQMAQEVISRASTSIKVSVS